MFWDNVAWVYDLFANFINRKANRALCEAVAQMIQPEDEALECACGTGLLSGVIATRCKSLIATDFSVNMLRRAERKYRNLPNIRFELRALVAALIVCDKLRKLPAESRVRTSDFPKSLPNINSRLCSRHSGWFFLFHMAFTPSSVSYLLIKYKPIIQITMPITLFTVIGSRNNTYPAISKPTAIRELCTI